MDIQLHVLEKVQVGAFIHAVAFTLFFYDYLLTVSDEIKLVWHKPQKPLGRLLFFMNRYLAFIDVPLSFYNQVAAGLPDAQCQRIDSVAGGMFFVGILVSELIMILRVWILWGQTRIITIILILMVMITAIFCAVEMAQSDYQLISLAFIGRRGCYPTRGSPLSPSIPILGLVDETGDYVAH
ncbi:hypothetical protein ONZ45_g12112 [Pleurotus djamor]|nr:hypothetical protein ONZ45_g12112 [Pleurotus djamor]